jgi:6-pyruvoyltetrahydropterin/6-carboxytetrahydropterin synthase
MQNVIISRKFEFSASHRYWREDWSPEENEKHFGKCISPHGHGHNYELHVSISGNIDPKTGMIVNLTVLKERVKKIVDQFDHKFLNLDTPYFKDKIPTTENIALVLFELIEKELSENGGYNLVKIRLYERQDLYADVWK